MVSRAAAVLSLVLLASSSGAGQNISGSITGTIVDPKGLAIPSATVVLRNAATKAELNAASNDSGVFEFLSLLPGTYDIEVQMTGFKKLVRSGHVLNANQRLSVGPLALEIGEFSESVV